MWRCDERVEKGDGEVEGRREGEGGREVISIALCDGKEVVKL